MQSCTMQLATNGNKAAGHTDLILYQVQLPIGIRQHLTNYCTTQLLIEKAVISSNAAAKRNRYGLINKVVIGF